MADAFGPAIAMLETSSIARGIEATDAMLKRAAVELLLTTIVPRGKYLVLAISQARELESLDDLSTSDIVKLSPYFTNAADLVGKQRYQLTQMTVRGDERLSVLFD